MPNQSVRRAYQSYGPKPESAFNFELVSLAIAVINLLLFIKFQISFIGRVLMFAKLHHPELTATHASFFTRFLIVVGIIDLLIFLPFLSAPYWLALLIARNKSKIAQVLYYIGAAALFPSAFGHMYVHGFLTLTGALVLAELIMFALAAVYLNLPATREWLAA